MLKVRCQRSTQNSTIRNNTFRTSHKKQETKQRADLEHDEERRERGKRYKKWTKKSQNQEDNKNSRNIQRAQNLKPVRSRAPRGMRDGKKMF